MAYRRIFPLLVAALIYAHAGAVELGEPRVSSYKGQALVADIELSSVDDPALPVQVRVANPEVYRGASIGVPPVLSALTLNVVQKGGKQYVHVTSNRPVDTDMLHLFLELGQGNGRDVRLATLWLTPDPRPAPPPVVVAVPVAPPVVAAAPVVVAPITAPASEVHAPARAPGIAPAPLHLAPVNTALPASVRSAPPASCKASASSNACAVLDTKNVALQAKLVGLEDKIKLLEATLAPAKGAVAATTMAAAALVQPAGESHPASIVPPLPAVEPPAEPVPVLVTPKKHKPPVPAAAPSATPWLWIGVAAVVALAAIGAIVFLLMSRRKAAAPAPAAPAAPKPRLLDRLKQRFARTKAAPAEA
jgi:hypothetical protein